MKYSKTLAFMLVAAAFFCMFAFAEEGDEAKPDAVKMAPGDLLMMYSPYVLMMREGGLPVANAEQPGGAQAPGQGFGMMARSWNAAYQISDTMVMYPINMQMRSAQKFRRAMGGLHDDKITVGAPNGGKFEGAELGMKVSACVAFATVELAADAGAVKIDLANGKPAKIGDNVYLISRRGDEWNFAPFYLPASINGELKDGNTTFYSLTLSQQQLGDEALGALVVREDGDVLGIVSRYGTKAYGLVVAPLANFKEGAEIAVADFKKLDTWEQVPDMPRTQGGRNPGGFNPGGDNTNPGGRNPGGRNPGGRNPGEQGETPPQQQ